MKTIRFIGMVLMTVLLSVSFAACGGDDDEGDSTSTSGKYSVSLSTSKSNTKNGKWYYKATIKVSGANASDVTVLGVKFQKSGESHASYEEAGGATTSATCTFGPLESGNTYYVNAYANISGTRVESSKQTIRLR